MIWERNVWRSIELKDIARKLKSMQPYLDNWGITDVDLVDDTIGLCNPDLPHRKRYRRKRMSKREKDFFYDYSRAIALTPEAVPHLIESYSDIFSSNEHPVCFALEGAKYELKKVRELLDKNIEAGFAICRNGAVTDIVEGDEDKLHTGTYFEEFCKERNSQVWVDVHSHPSGVEMPTIADMVNVAQEGGGNTWACVVTKKGIVCVKPKGEAKEIADKLHKKSSKDEDFRKLYDEYAKTLQPYERWRSYDIVERNVEVCKCE